MRLFRRMGVVAGCLALAACKGDVTGVTGEEMELSTAQRLWEQEGVDDYRMTVRLTGAWIGGAAVIHVRNGVPVSVQPVGELGPESSRMFSGYDTVQELFGILEHAVAQDADHIHATYHSRYGLPVDVYVDYRESWADDESGFIVETFDRL